MIEAFWWAVLLLILVFSLLVLMYCLLFVLWMINNTVMAIIHRSEKKDETVSVDMFKYCEKDVEESLRLHDKPE